MKLFHLSDLHLGKRLGGCSLLEDQRYILRQIAELAAAEKPDGVLLAGDVYDRAAPAAEAVELFDDFLVSLFRLGTRIFVISGNHDCPERLAFGGRLMEKSGVHIAPVYTGEVKPVTLEDAWGPVDFYLLPFVKPVHVRACFPEEELTTYTAAVAAAIEHMNVDARRRNVLLTHQFVTGAVRCQSEEISVGGSDNVEVSVFAPFDYVALGHIHSPQAVGRETVRYCGTPLKYSLSEAEQSKSVTVVELKEKGAVSLRTIPLHPLRELRHLRGSYEELTLKSFYDGKGYGEDYVYLTLTDEEDVPNAAGRLQVIYKNLLGLRYDNARAKNGGGAAAAQAEERQPLELFEEFYTRQNGKAMSREQRELIAGLLEEIWEEEETP